MTIVTDMKSVKELSSALDIQRQSKFIYRLYFHFSLLNKRGCKSYHNVKNTSFLLFCLIQQHERLRPSLQAMVDTDDQNVMGHCLI